MIKSPTVRVTILNVCKKYWVLRMKTRPENVWNLLKSVWKILWMSSLGRCQPRLIFNRGLFSTDRFRYFFEYRNGPIPVFFWIPESTDSGIFLNTGIDRFRYFFEYRNWNYWINWPIPKLKIGLGSSTDAYLIVHQPTPILLEEQTVQQSSQNEAHWSSWIHSESDCQSQRLSNWGWNCSIF